MYLDNILFWTTVLSGIIIGLVVGGILGLAGYYIWKRQHLYSKKLDAYTTILNSIFLLDGVIQNRFLNKNETSLEFDLKINENITTLLKESVVFCFYFGEQYYTPIQNIINMYFKLKKNEDIKMTIDDLKEYESKNIEEIKNVRIK